MSKNLNDIDTRSEEVQDLLGRVPSWITRNGILLVIFVLMMLISGSWFFKYPDIITASVVVTSDNPPVHLLARVDGKLTSVRIRDKEKVEQGELLAMLESSLNYEDLTDLKEQLALLAPFLKDYKPNQVISFQRNYLLGEIQPQFADFSKKYRDYLQFIDRNYYPGKIKSQQKQLTLSKSGYKSQLTKKKVLEEELQIIRKKYQRDSVLNRKGVLASEELEKSKRELLQKQLQYAEVLSALSSTALSMEQAGQMVAEAKNLSGLQVSALQLALKEAYEVLLGAIDVWELNYLIKSPVNGEVNFSKFWSSNQNVSKGETVFTVVPEGTNVLTGKVKLKMSGAGKVKVGQKVNLKFANYPYLEYGMVKGEVSRISGGPTNDYYALEVDLPEQLISTYGKKFEFQQELQGTAEIITEDQRLLNRILNPVRAIFSERFEK
ncbi:MAG TPA: HlyD family efflux transporter periplasmic adaptor subunit [Prolixibacteraceae bacterium]|nr:HlyD family efflux transporter periplasmic adaptor subunit [Prolixibacteraceae bacterium]